ncbi:MAG TPA: GNVR domain-containing protein [Vicinamibacterales bacterium]|nr:GNVR domain-containing protein [Vicinamibacterales bacterium]
MPHSPHSPLVGYLDTLRRRWALATVACSAVLAAIVPFALGLPDMYRASATILVEGRLFEGLGANSAELDARLQTIKQEALSRARLTDLINEFGLYSVPTTTSLSEALNRLQRDIEIDVTSTTQVSGQPTTVAFKLSYTGASPDTVARVTNALASFYIAQNEKLKSIALSYRTDALKGALADAKKKLEDQERRVAAFTRSNVGMLPAQFEANQAALVRISQQLQVNANEQIGERDRRQTLLNQIFELRNVRPGDEADPRVALTLKTNQLAALRLTETADSPNVRAVEREIATLNKQVALQESGSGGVISRQSRLDNLMTELADTETHLQKLAKDDAELRRSLEVYQSRIEQSAAQNSELESLMWDYRAARDSYGSMLRRLDEAQISERAGQTQGAEQVRILDAAVSPTTPAGPARLRLMVIGLLLALVVGVAIAFAVDWFDTSFHSIDDLRAFTHVPVIASIPPILTRHDRIRKSLVQGALATGATFLLVLVGTGAFLLAQESDSLARTLLRLV